MTVLKQPVAIAGVLILYATTVLGIGANPARNNQAEVEKHGKLEASAFALLDGLVSEIQGLKTPENRIFAKVDIGRMLWRKDPDRALKLFQQATDELTGLLNSKARPNSEVGPATEASSSSSRQARNPIVTLRQEILSILIGCDPKMGLEFQRTVPVPAVLMTPEARYNETETELWLANQLASTDPPVALQAAEEALKHPLVGNVTYTLVQLMQKDQEAGVKFAEDIVRRIKSEDLLADFMPLSVTMDILDRASRAQPGSRSRGGASAMGAGPASAGSPHLILPDALARELMELLVGAALRGDISPGNINQTERGNTLYILKWLDSRATLTGKYAPNSLPDLNKKLNQFHRIRTANKVSAVGSKTTSTGNSVEKSSVSLKAAKDQESNRNQQISKGQNKINQALPAASRLQIKQLARKYVDIAWSLIEKGNRKQANLVLERAWKLVGGRTADPEQISAQFDIASSFRWLDLTRTKTNMGLAIDNLNGVVATAGADLFNLPLYDSFEGGALRSDAQSSNEVLHSILEGCGAYLELIARVDFDLAAGLSEKVKEREANFIVQLGMVDRLIKNAPPPPMHSGNDSLEAVSVNKLL